MKRKDEIEMIHGRSTNTVDNIFHVSFLIKDRNVDSEESIVFGGYSARVDQARRSGMNSSVEFV